MSKKILGLDLGTNSIGWALVEEAENENEQSAIIKLGVRVNPLSTDEKKLFEEGKPQAGNAARTTSRSARRNLQRYKMRRDNLIQLLKTHGFIGDDFVFSEEGNASTFETYRNRAKAATERISLANLAKVLMMINKKRGYKSSKKVKNNEEGQLVDGMAIAKMLYEQNLTPGQLVHHLLNNNTKTIPDFYRSDLVEELNKIWKFQSTFHATVLTNEHKEKLQSLKKLATKDYFLKQLKIETIELKGTATDKKIQRYALRAKAINTALTLPEIAEVVGEVNGDINNSSGYLGAISDRSKELYFDKITVGQYYNNLLVNEPHTSLANKVFYRQDFMDEFEKIWETQAAFYKETLTKELKEEIRDVVIFYQRRLKSQKGLISFCEFEQQQIEVVIDGKTKVKTRGLRVCPKSSPLFQEFKIWQVLNNLEYTHIKTKEKNTLHIEDKQILFNELNRKHKLTSTELLELLFGKKHKEYELNYKSIEGNRTNGALHEAYHKIVDILGNDAVDFKVLDAAQELQVLTTLFENNGINTAILTFDALLDDKALQAQAHFKLWHLLYSFEGDKSNTGTENLINLLCNNYGFNKECALLLSNVSMQEDYGSLSAKAIRKILPHLKDGLQYDEACAYAGYNHSKNSLTTEQKENKIYKEQLTILPKNSLRNPVVEKILNQMVNVVNAAIATYGKPDEVRIELAREMKKSTEERKSMHESMTKANKEHEIYRKKLQTEFGLAHVSRNDIIKYKLYLELEPNGYKTWYSNTYIAPDKLFSKDFDVEHIIPKAKLFDDSFSNKTLEAKAVNIKKANATAYDFVCAEYGETGTKIEEYIKRIEDAYKRFKISRTKLQKLKMKLSEIPQGFIDRDLRQTQYIAKKAKQMMEEVFKTVNTTTGTVTDRLRDDWQLVDVMQELNWDKYNAQGLTHEIVTKDGKIIKRITDWTKRNDHRHHAMDALTVAFTKPSHIQYLNNLSARSDKNGSIAGIEKKELYRDDKNKMRFKSPIPLQEFRSQAKQHLQNILISQKAKNKVVTTNINKTKLANGKTKSVQTLTPRGQLHEDTIQGMVKRYETKAVKVNKSLTLAIIHQVAKKVYREALLKRMADNNNDAKAAFDGKNNISKTPIYIDALQTYKVPDTVKIVWEETLYTKRKEVNKDLNIDKVLDPKIKALLQQRLALYNNKPELAFSNLADNPIWLNEGKGIAIKRVAITGVSNAVALHSKKDKNGKLILDNTNAPIATSFVNTGNNHHVAIYKDAEGNLHENVVSFFEAVARVNQGLTSIDTLYNAHEGWEFMFTMKQNEYFVFPNATTGFNPHEINLLDPNNNHLISPNLFRVQKIATKNYFFRHHLETSVDNKKELSSITYKPQLGLNGIVGIIKVRVNHIGIIEKIGE